MITDTLDSFFKVSGFGVDLASKKNDYWYNDIVNGSFKAPRESGL